MFKNIIKLYVVNKLVLELLKKVNYLKIDTF